MTDGPLLEPGEPEPFRVSGRRSISPFLIVCDHAGHKIPRRLGTLGLSRQARKSHRVWDLGAEELSRNLGTALGAMVVSQRYSRLVIDCNRPLSAPDLILETSDGTAIPGNVGLSPEAIAERVKVIFEPYHRYISDELDRRAEAGRPTILVAMHSFTPIMGGVARPWHAGVLFDRDDRLGEALFALLSQERSLVIGRNQPYAAGRESDYSLIHHGEDRGVLSVELEIRQDLIADEAGQSQWTQRLATHLRRAIATLST